MNKELLIVVLISAMLQIGLLILLLLHTERLGNVYERANADLSERWANEREAWVLERQQLLDRIQAPSFSEFKHAEVKLIKAKLGMTEPTPLEPL
ncbi:hypothetical protein SAMN04487969_10639 [Paenibacillus algorifonticola]|uniref:Uncharacterized protein n=1 Tax=Paenibacillus algorifonticola TaxID=684063 RepID=A0A1I2D1B8_9BACL|nr:hypothetical protein [Paenibacillus algorifonticola]SFE74301.1 hypothetical protein SAMN04487969_10639 [Paenibacillus algorifonticola]